jgi:hypothetical protein
MNFTSTIRRRAFCASTLADLAGSSARAQQQRPLSNYTTRQQPQLPARQARAPSFTIVNNSLTKLVTTLETFLYESRLCVERTDRESEVAAMRRLGIALLLLAFAITAQWGAAQPSSQSPTAPTNSTGSGLIVVPAGTTVPLAITDAIMAKTAKPGENVYAQTAFPVTADRQMAIPAGTYVRGQIDTLKKPGIFSPHAEFEIHLTQIIFANGYTVNLST